MEYNSEEDYDQYRLDYSAKRIEREGGEEEDYYIQLEQDFRNNLWLGIEYDWIC